MQEVLLEHVLFMTFLAREAPLKAREHLWVLLDLYLDLFVGGFEDLEGLASDP